MLLVPSNENTKYRVEPLKGNCNVLNHSNKMSAGGAVQMLRKNKTNFSQHPFSVWRLFEKYSFPPFSRLELTQGQ